MSPFNLYISFDREIRNRKDGLFVNTAETTYWLNKAVQEFVDKKYAEFEQNDDISQDLKSLYKASVVSVDTDSYNFLHCYKATLPDNVRYITSERVLIVLNSDSTSLNVKVTPITQDTINIKVKDPFSQHNLHMGKAEPLRLVEGTESLFISDGSYSVTEYYIKYIQEPTKFVINSALDKTEITEFPHKSFKEILAIAVRMFLENYSNERYKTYNLEESKTEL
jgi:hypothetical protein